MLLNIFANTHRTAGGGAGTLSLKFFCLHFFLDRYLAFFVPHGGHPRDRMGGTNAHEPALVACLLTMGQLRVATGV